MMTKLKKGTTSTIRQNYQIESSANIYDDPPILHVFGRTHEDKDQNELLNALDNNSKLFEYHITLEDLANFDKRHANSKNIAVFVTTVLN